MDILNSISFRKMLEKCSDCSGYRGIIVFKTASVLKEFIRELVALNKESAIPGIRIIKQLVNSGLVEFTNDSVIQLITESTSARGRRCHAMLLEDEISNEVRDILSSMIMPYDRVQYEKAFWGEETSWVRKINGKWIKDNRPPVDPMENVTDTKELDNFLNKFTVNS